MLMVSEYSRMLEESPAHKSSLDEEERKSSSKNNSTYEMISNDVSEKQESSNFSPTRIIGKRHFDNVNTKNGPKDITINTED